MYSNISFSSFRGMLIVICEFFCEISVTSMSDLTLLISSKWNSVKRSQTSFRKTLPVPTRKQSKRTHYLILDKTILFSSKLRNHFFPMIGESNYYYYKRYKII